MYELEEGEVSEDDYQGESEDEEGGEEEGDVEECMAASLFDALAAAQETNEKYRQMEDEPREDHRLPEHFLTQSFKAAIKRPWRSEAVEDISRAIACELENRFRVGYMCEAVWPGDDGWYPARIVRVKSWKSRIVVRYSGFSQAEEEELQADQIRGVAKDRKRCRIKLGTLKKNRTKRAKKRKHDKASEHVGDNEPMNVT